MAAAAAIALAGAGCSAGPAAAGDAGKAMDAGTDGAAAGDGAVADAAVEAGRDAPTCRRVCGDGCCEVGQVCTPDETCCPRDELCGDRCCGSGEVCEGALCHLDCGDRVRCRGDDGEEVCCGEDELCSSGRCFEPTTGCRDYVDCAEGEYCEPALGMCLPQPEGERCAEEPPSGGEVRPTEVWHWDGEGAALPAYNQVMMTPAVVNLTDDNEDGAVDEDDIPDVVFSSFCGEPDAGCEVGDYHTDGVLRAVSGEDGSSIWDVTDPDLRVIGGAQVAVGDIDGDGLVEIVACGSDPSFEGPLMAFSHDGSLVWKTTDPDVACGQSGPAIADLDGDGAPEVFVRYSVVDGATGELRWHRACRNTGGPWRSHEHNPCDYTTAADLDGDGELELVGGNVAYRADGSTLWDRSDELRDGYPAVADLDLDGAPEVVVVQSAFYPEYAKGDHHVRALRNDGTDLWGPVDINFGHAIEEHEVEGTVAGGGPPTIANFDDDPQPEIALAGGYGYAVIEHDGELKWFAPTRDLSSRKTGSSVFDFDGDGVAEAVYNDEYWLRVYNGPDGTVRYCECNTTATHWEYPVIADVDNDGHAEIVVVSNDWYIGGCPEVAAVDPCTEALVEEGETQGTHGVRVFASPRRDWVATRRIWNQHTYHVTNVSESGAIPTEERRNWESRGLNNFRQNVQPGATNLPDLEPIELSVDVRPCPDHMILHFRVHNAGWSAAPAGVPVTVYVESDGAFEPVARTETTSLLLPGESEPLRVELPLDGGSLWETVRFRVVVNDPDDEPVDLDECRDDNAAEVTAGCDTVF